MRISLQPKSARGLCAPQGWSLVPAGHPAFVNSLNATGMFGAVWLINCGFDLHAASTRSKHIGSQRLFLFMAFSSGVHRLSAFSVSKNGISTIKITKLKIMLIAIGKIQSEMMGMSIRKLYEYLTQCKGSKGSHLTVYVSGRAWTRLGSRKARWTFRQFDFR